MQFLSTYLVCQKAVYSFVHFTTLNANSRFLYHELNTEKELLKAEKDLLEKNSPHCSGRTPFILIHRKKVLVS